MKIKFKLTHGQLAQASFRRVFHEVFGGDLLKDIPGEFDNGLGRGGDRKQVSILCTPEDFCCFLKARESAGLYNQWKELEVEILPESKVLPIKTKTRGNISAIDTVSRTVYFKHRSK